MFSIASVFNLFIVDFEESRLNKAFGETYKV